MVSPRKACSTRSFNLTYPVFIHLSFALEHFTFLSFCISYLMLLLFLSGWHLTPPHCFLFFHSSSKFLLLQLFLPESSNYISSHTIGFSGFHQTNQVPQEGNINSTHFYVFKQMQHLFGQLNKKSAIESSMHNLIQVAFLRL